MIDGYFQLSEIYQNSCFSKHIVYVLSVDLCSTVFELPGGWGVEPHTSPCRPPKSGQNSIPGGRVSIPHLRFAEVGMLLYSHFFLMQFLKYMYLQRDDLNVYYLNSY